MIDIPIPKDLLQTKYRLVELDGSFGVINKGVINPSSLCERVLEQGRDYGPRAGWRDEDYFVKKLDNDELYGGRLPLRFLNAINIARKNAGVIPSPVGFVFEGSPYELLCEKSRLDGYYVSRFVDGEQLMKSWKQLSPEKRLRITTSICVHLERLRYREIFLMDFAPRDIVVKHNFPLFADTEHVEYAVRNPDELSKKQALQFEEDFRDFLPDDPRRKFMKRLAGCVQ